MLQITVKGEDVVDVEAEFSFLAKSEGDQSYALVLVSFQSRPCRKVEGKKEAETRFHAQVTFCEILFTRRHLNAASQSI